MAIERKNSFHLMLSDDELGLLRLLAEREGLNASDFLRTTLRRLAGASPQVAMMIGVGAALGSEELAKVVGRYSKK
ncbi:MAG TPA: hypothetical protein VIF62_27040 [Labilithrix sp.]|jgi:predicted transcriptional regulator